MSTLTSDAFAPARTAMAFSMATWATGSVPSGFPVGSPIPNGNGDQPLGPMGQKPFFWSFHEENDGHFRCGEILNHWISG